ncbi:MAG: PaaI family thioesterase [Rhodospirillales bacterium]
MYKALRDRVQARDVAGLFALVPYAQTIGLEGFLDTRGKLMTVLRARPENVGNTYLPAIHGGVLAALLEHAAIMTLVWEADLPAIPRIINLSVDYLRPALLVDTFATADVIRQGKRIANLRVTAWQNDPDRPVVAAHSHCLIAD